VTVLYAFAAFAGLSSEGTVAGTLDALSAASVPGCPAYGRLCRLLTIGKARAGKGACHLDWPDVEEWNEGLLGIIVRSGESNNGRNARLSGGGRDPAQARRFIRQKAPGQGTIPAPAEDTGKIGKLAG
jgi:hypothetical protein